MENVSEAIAYAEKFGSLFIEYGNPEMVGFHPECEISKEKKMEILDVLHPYKTEILEILHAEERAKKEKQARTIHVYLSSRGWGDYSSVCIDIDPEEGTMTDWVAAGRKALDTAHDVDNKLTDAEIEQHITSEIEKRAELAAKKAAETESENKKREEALQDVESVETTENVTADEGGKTVVYTHTVTLKNGTVLKFTDRNLFDVGRTVNPVYSLADGLAPGGIRVLINGQYVWQNFDENKNKWYTVRPLTDDENIAINALDYYGHGHCATRMGE